MTDPNADILTWLDTAEDATREQAVALCAQAAAEIRRLRGTAPAQAMPAGQQAQWVLIADYDTLTDRVHGAENFRLFRSRDDLYDYAVEHGLVVQEARYVQRACQAWPIDRTAFVAEFRPEAWLHDNAIPVDAQGDTIWEVTKAFLRIDAGDHDDVTRDPAAPDWIRAWSGPFTLAITARAT